MHPRASAKTILLAAALLCAADPHSRAQKSQTSTQTRGQQSNGSSQTSTTPSTSGSTNTTTDPFELTGHVFNARTNAGVPRALVRYGSRAVLTNHDGLFTFPQVTSNTGSLIPSKPGFYATPTGNDNSNRSLAFAPNIPVDLLLYPEAILSGTVADRSGEGLPEFSIVIRRSSFDENGHHWLPTGTTRTTPTGTYRIPLPAGDYVIQGRSNARPRGDAEVYLPVSVPTDSTSIAQAIHLKPGDQTQINLRPEQRRAYEVTITSDAGDVRGFPRLTAHNTDGLAIPVQPLPGRNEPGVFRVLLPAGSYTLTASMQQREGDMEAETRINVAGHDGAGAVLHYNAAPRFPVELTTEPDIVTTTTTTVPGPSQLGLSLVSVVTTGDAVEQRAQSTANPDGTFSFSVPIGTYRLQARATGQWYLTAADYGGTNLLLQPLVVASGMGGQPIRIRINNQSASLTGTVTLAGQPASATVYLIATGPSATPVLLLRSNTDGTFTRGYMAPGSYHVLATERPVSADLRDPATMTRYLGKMQTLTLNPGGQQTLTLEAVSLAEMPQ